jgi:uncharacterized protein YhbP (UPF0306 family)
MSKQLLFEYLAKYRTMSLATSDGAGDVNCATVCYTFDDSARIYFACSSKTLKARHLGQNARVGVTMDDGGQSMMGVQVRGTAQPMSDATSISDARGRLTERHPSIAEFYASPDLLFFRIEPSECFVINFSWGVDSRLPVQL